MSVAPYSDDQWFVTIGNLDNPYTKVPAYITNKISLCNVKNLSFQPFEIKKVQVVAKRNGLSKELFNENPRHLSVKSCENLNASPFFLFDEREGEDGTLLIENRSPNLVTLPAGIELAESDVDLSAYQIAQPKEKVDLDLELVEGDQAVLSTVDLEKFLEPGLCAPDFIDKNLELDFIRTHKSIPAAYKKEFISFLEERSELFSGEEFSKKSFPSDIFMHDVELIEDIPQLSSRPFPVSGIRLQQLKADIKELVKNGVLSPGDSEFTSPLG
jgi:hypothetical protein